MNFGFRGSLNENTLASRGQKLIYWGPLKPLENLLLRSPIVPWSYFASRAYHDGFWYPINGKPRVEKILATDWGKLFERYGSGRRCSALDSRPRGLGSRSGLGPEVGQGSTESRTRVKLRAWPDRRRPRVEPRRR